MALPPLPPSLGVIAACNPYRRKRGLGLTEETNAGLQFAAHAAATDGNVGSGIHDPLKDLVYRVHPLPGRRSAAAGRVAAFGAR